VGFFRGFLAPFRGGVYVLREGLWHYLILPLALNIALAIGIVTVVFPYFKEELAQKLGGAAMTGWWWLVLILLTIVGAVGLFVALQPVLSAIFCDRLSETVEKRVRGSAPAAALLPSVGRALLHGVLKLALYGVAVALGLVLTIFTGVGGVIGVGVAGVFMAYDAFDYPLSRRGATFAGKWAYLARRPMQTAGYALGASLLYLVLPVFFAVPSFLATGATLAFLDTEQPAKTA
jgi:uncharacterized protein involved in cysteine biosynthesis